MMHFTHAALLNPSFAVVDLSDHGRYHILTGEDHGDPHDHREWGFTTRIVAGGYVEEVFDLKNPQDVQVIVRAQGDMFRVEPDHIHRIIRHLDGVTVTHVAPDVNTGNGPAHAYQFRPEGVFSRPVFGGEWMEVQL